MVKAFGLFFEDKLIWLILGGSVLFSFILAIGVILLDTRMINVVDYFPTVFSNERQSGQINLEPASGFPFSVATFTFGTMLSVISFYSSNFSPGLLRIFSYRKHLCKLWGFSWWFYLLSFLFFFYAQFRR